MAKEQLFREVLCLLLASPSQGGCGQDIVNLFQLLHQRRCPYLGRRNVQKLKDDLQNCTLLFEVETDRRSCTVFPKTSLTICPRHSNKSGSCPDGTCPDLHLCMFFLLCGECRYGNHCHFGHNLGTPQNKSLLQRHLLAGLCITDLRILFCLPRVRQGVTIPQVCRYYNMPRGCNKGSECRCLHLCLDNILEQCESVDNCEKNHDMGHSQVSNVLTLYGVRLACRSNSDVLREVRFYHNHICQSRQGRPDEPEHRARTAKGATPKRFSSVPNLLHGQKMSVASGHDESGQRAPSAGRRTRHVSGSAYSRLASPHSSAKEEEICLYHLKGECRFKESCKRLHCSDAFLWRLIQMEELEERGAVTAWTSLPPDSNQTLEEAFCQPEETGCVVTNAFDDEVNVNFRDMTAENMRTTHKYKVCRLSIQGGDFATVWVWYWRNQNGFWQEFGREENGRLPVTSKTVEQHYKIDARNPMEFGHFVLYFTKMRMKDVDEDCKFKVRRRPLPVLRNHDDESDADAGDSPRVVGGAVGGMMRLDWPRLDSVHTDEERSQGGNDSDSDDVRDDQAGASNVVSEDDRDDEARASDVLTPAVPVGNILSPVHPSSEDYKAVQKRFVNTLGKACTVAAIHRVVNPRLEARYQKMMLSMKTRSRGKGIKEKELYYRPTQNEDVTEIYTNGANCDNPPVTVNGRNLGRGGFFCLTASEANKGVKNNNKKKQRMFLMKCLVSHHTAAQSSAQGYDCHVDDVYDPKIFVIENPSQTCPVYLITYSLR